MLFCLIQFFLLTLGVNLSMSLSPYSSRNLELPVGRLDLDENIRDGEHSWENEQMRIGQMGVG